MRRKLIIWGNIICFLLINIFLIELLINEFNEFPLKAPPVKIEPIWGMPQIYYVEDLDGDGIKEIVGRQPFPPITDKSEWSVFHLERKGYIFPYLGEFLGPLRGYLIKIERKKINGKEKLVFKFITSKNYKVLIEEYDNQGSLLHFRYLESPSIKAAVPENKYKLNYIQQVDLDGDGKKELIGLFNASYWRFPRGMVAYDIYSGKLKWEYYCGPEITDPYVVKDLDRDGKKEIIFGTFAVNNGAFINNTDDRHSYLIVLNYKGKELWKRELGGWYTVIYAEVADLEGDGYQEVIASKSCHRGRDIPPVYVWIFNGSNGEIKAVYSEKEISFSRPYATFERGEAFIYVGDSGGTLRKFDTKLNLVKAIELGEAVSVVNPRTSSQWKYIYALGANHFFVLTKDLKLIHKYKLEHSVTNLGNIAKEVMFPYCEEPVRKAVVRADRIYKVVEFKSIPLIEKVLALLKSKILLISLVLFLFNYLAFLNFRTYTKTDYKKLQRVENTFMQWSDVMQELAHRMRTPLSTLLWGVERMKKLIEKHPPEKEKIAKKLKTIEEDLEVLKGITQSMMKLFSVHKPKMQEIALGSFLSSIVERFRETLGSHIEIELKMENDLKIWADQELLREAILNVIQNAIEAMPEGGKLIINAYPIHNFLTGEIRKIVIEIEDTGCGIEEEELERIFQPHYSTKKKGMGIGLTITKRIIEAHGGQIEVHSKKGVGTKIAIYLPWKKEER